MNSTMILGYFKYFLSMIKNIEKQNKNLNNPESSKKLKIFIPKNKEFIIISDESNINYEDYKNLSPLNIKLYLIKPKDSIICKNFKQFAKDLQKSDEIIDFKVYDDNNKDNDNQIIEIEWNIFTKFYLKSPKYYQGMSVSKPFRNDNLIYKYEYENFGICFNEEENKMLYLFNFKYVDKSMLDNNKNFESLINLIDKLPEIITSKRFGINRKKLVDLMDEYWKDEIKNNFIVTRTNLSKNIILVIFSILIFWGSFLWK